MGKSFFEADKYPAITFRSTKVAVTGPNTAKVTGDFTLHGITKPVTLDVTYNGGWPANAMDGARIGFSAHGSLKRSAFGMGFGVPAPGSNLGVGDDVEVTIETEFSSGGPLAKAK
jgi:polyisoprenoid-binding protein YceI